MRVSWIGRFSQLLPANCYSRLARRAGERGSGDTDPAFVSGCCGTSGRLRVRSGFSTIPSTAGLPATLVSGNEQSVTARHEATATTNRQPT